MNELELKKLNRKLFFESIVVFIIFLTIGVGVATGLFFLIMGACHA